MQFLLKIIPHSTRVATLLRKTLVQRNSVVAHSCLCERSLLTQILYMYVCVCFSIAEDTAHSERYMGMATPGDNLDGYEASAVLCFHSTFYCRP